MVVWEYLWHIRLGYVLKVPDNSNHTEVVVSDAMGRLKALLSGLADERVTIRQGNLAWHIQEGTYRSYNKLLYFTVKIRIIGWFKNPGLGALSLTLFPEPHFFFGTCV